MDTFLRNYLWTLDLVVVGICAVFLALAASSLVEARLPPAPPQPAVNHTRSKISTASAKKSPNVILRRNIFCSQCPPILPDGEPEPREASAEGPSEPQPTDLPLTLLAVMYAPSPKRQQWSTAVIRDEEDKAFGAFGVGAMVHGAVLLSIQPTRVDLDNAGDKEYLDLLTPRKSAPPAPKPAPTPPPPPHRPPPSAKTVAADSAFLAELDRGVKKLGDLKYEVQRGTLDAVVGNLALLSRAARIVPQARSGKATGLRLFTVRPDGPFAKIGLQNGDTLVSINGFEVSSPQKALDIYTKLKSANHVTLGLERSGNQVAQEYTIR